MSWTLWWFNFHHSICFTFCVDEWNRHLTISNNGYDVEIVDMPFAYRNAWRRRRRLRRYSHHSVAESFRPELVAHVCLSESEPRENISQTRRRPHDNIMLLRLQQSTAAANEFQAIGQYWGYRGREWLISQRQLCHYPPDSSFSSSSSYTFTEFAFVAPQIDTIRLWVCRKYQTIVWWSHNSG